MVDPVIVRTVDSAHWPHGRLHDFDAVAADLGPSIDASSEVPVMSSLHHHLTSVNDQITDLTQQLAETHRHKAQLKLTKQLMATIFRMKSIKRLQKRTTDIVARLSERVKEGTAAADKVRAAARKDVDEFKARQRTFATELKTLTVGVARDGAKIARLNERKVRMDALEERYRAEAERQRERIEAVRSGLSADDFARGDGRLRGDGAARRAATADARVLAALSGARFSAASGDEAAADAGARGAAADAQATAHDGARDASAVLSDAELDRESAQLERDFAEVDAAAPAAAGQENESAAAAQAAAAGEAAAETENGAEGAAEAEQSGEALSAASAALSAVDGADARDGVASAEQDLVEAE